MKLHRCPVCEMDLSEPALRFVWTAAADAEFRLAEHLLVAHLPWKYAREVTCWCGLVMSAQVVVLMAHLKDKGGALEHYLACLLGID